MPVGLLRSLLLEMIGGLPESGSRGDVPGLGTRYLVIVARSEPALYEHLRNRHSSDSRVRVVLDRRGAADDALELPPVERRGRRSWLATGASHELVALPHQNTADTSIHPQEAPRAMNDSELLDDRQRVIRWLDESQHQLGRVIPAMLEDRDNLRRALGATEQECERLRGELEHLRQVVSALQAEVQTLRTERTAMADAFGGVVDLLGQLQRPLVEISRRLQAPERVPAEVAAV